MTFKCLKYLLSNLEKTFLTSNNVPVKTSAVSRQVIEKFQITEGYFLFAEPKDIASEVVAGINCNSKGKEVDYDINTESYEWDEEKINGINFALDELLELPNKKLAK